ncbi:hypothetical protein DRN75_04030 [Nanoarchaeota archaeon]|nr:MAG: hypothetical protein DRN75_04030 [Nanoarchaeota archaeon]
MRIKYAVISAVLFTVTGIFMKISTLYGNIFTHPTLEGWLYFGAGAVINLAAMYLGQRALYEEKAAIVNAITSSIIVILTLIVGVFIFSEVITPIKAIGITLTTASIAIMR